MDITTVIAAFQQQGAQMLEPGVPAEIDNAIEATGIKLDRFYEDFYRHFGGFSCPSRNLVTLWSITHVVDEKKLWKLNQGLMYFPVGDMLIESDFIMAPLSDATKPPFLLFENRQIANSTFDLIERVASGDVQLGFP